MNDLKIIYPVLPNKLYAMYKGHCIATGYCLEHFIDTVQMGYERLLREDEAIIVNENLDVLARISCQP